MMITILMAAYNGEKYIAEQIESILHQTEQDWKLVIQDDCSKDDTFGIAGEYARKYPGRIFAVQRKAPSGSAQNNFFSMLRFADGEYMMFCDDDDVWLPKKIAATLAEMKRLETAFGAGTPLLVHTDLRVVDTGLNTRYASMMRAQKLDPYRTSLNRMLIQNVVTGCTMMIDQRLLELVVRQGLPHHAAMHDWWFALIASALGRIGFVPRATVLYRQHKSNRVGAKRANAIRYNFHRFVDSGGARRSLTATYEQAEEFLERFGGLLDEDQRQLVLDFTSIPTRSKCGRLFLLGRRGFWRSGFFRKCGQIWFT